MIKIEIELNIVPTRNSFLLWIIPFFFKTLVAMNPHRQRSNPSMGNAITEISQYTYIESNK